MAGAHPGGPGLRLVEAGLRECQSFGPLEAPDTVEVVVFVPASDADRVATALATALPERSPTHPGAAIASRAPGMFLAEEDAWAIGSVGPPERVAESTLEMMAPKGRETEVITALVAAHPYEEPGV